jgi:hypothetical protein
MTKKDSMFDGSERQTAGRETTEQTEATEITESGFGIKGLVSFEQRQLEGV